jgi:hypothetical protein
MSCSCLSHDPVPLFERCHNEKGTWQTVGVGLKFIRQMRQMANRTRMNTSIFATGGWRTNPEAFTIFSARLAAGTESDPGYKASACVHACALLETSAILHPYLRTEAGGGYLAVRGQQGRCRNAPRARRLTRWLFCFAWWLRSISHGNTIYSLQLS